MKLWEKGVTPERKVIEFTAGNDRKTDLSLAEWDIAVSMAHVIMLSETGLINKNEKKELLNSLNVLFEKNEEGELTIEEDIEDIHSQIEKELTGMLGPTGRKVHTGRSRNDQVLTGIRLFTRSEIDKLAHKIMLLFGLLLSESEKYKGVIIPGYTHMQPAMPSSFGLWFGAWAESLTDDLCVLAAARTLNTRNPLGTAAGYGSTLPLNRELTTELLEFDDLLYNSAYASINRGKAEMATASALASIAQTLSRFSTDVCLFMTAEFRFIDFPDELLTGSSIMPQKRNPDVFELIRGKSNLVQSLPGQVNALVSNLPSGYNRDLQLLKDLIFNGFATIDDCIDIMMIMLEKAIIREDIIKDPLYNQVFSTEEVNRLARIGMPFRDAYKKVAKDVRKGTFKTTSTEEYTHEGSIGNLCNDEIKLIFNKRMECFRSKTAGELIRKMMYL